MNPTYESEWEWWSCFSVGIGHRKYYHSMTMLQLIVYIRVRAQWMRFGEKKANEMKYEHWTIRVLCVCVCMNYDSDEMKLDYNNNTDNSKTILFAPISWF